MTEREIADWEREIRHAEKMQEQRASKQRNKHAVNSLLKTMIERGLIKKPKKEANNEINNQ